MGTIFILFVLFQIKHFVCDFLLQGRWMLHKFDDSFREFFLPLLAHAGINALGTLIICLAFSPSLWWLSLIDLATHFLIDRAKAGKRYFGKYKALSAAEMKDNIEILNKERLLGGGMHIEGIERAIKYNGYYYIILGCDQLAHNLVYIFIIWFLTK